MYMPMDSIMREVSAAASLCNTCDNGGKGAAPVYQQQDEENSDIADLKKFLNGPKSPARTSARKSRIKSKEDLSPKFKTTLCRNWSTVTPGYCSYGHLCKYAWGPRGLKIQCIYIYILYGCTGLANLAMLRQKFLEVFRLVVAWASAFHHQLFNTTLLTQIRAWPRRIAFVFRMPDLQNKGMSSHENIRLNHWPFLWHFRC